MQNSKKDYKCGMSGQIPWSCPERETPLSAWVLATPFGGVGAVGGHLWCTTAFKMVCQSFFHIIDCLLDYKPRGWAFSNHHFFF